MKKRTGKRNRACCFTLVTVTLALLLSTGCTASEATETLATMAGDIVRQMATFWVL